jgi:hypothetical protein
MFLDLEGVSPMMYVLTKEPVKIWVGVGWPVFLWPTSAQEDLVVTWTGVCVCNIYIYIERERERERERTHRDRETKRKKEKDTELGTGGSHL